MTNTDTWRRRAVETPGGWTLLLDPSDEYYVETRGRVAALRRALGTSSGRGQDLSRRRCSSPASGRSRER